MTDSDVCSSDLFGDIKITTVGGAKMKIIHPHKAEEDGAGGQRRRELVSGNPRRRRRCWVAGICCFRIHGVIAADCDWFGNPGRNRRARMNPPNVKSAYPCRRSIEREWRRDMMERRPSSYTIQRNCSSYSISPRLCRGLGSSWRSTSYLMAQLPSAMRNPRKAGG